MMFILDADEMAQVEKDRAVLRKLGGRDAEEALKNVCKMVADTMIPTSRTAFVGSSGRDRPYGCIHGDLPPHERYGYCDRCPVRGICPMPKDFSK